MTERNEIGYLAHRLARPYAEELHRRLAARGVTDLRPPFGIVLATAREEGVRVSEIAAAWGITTQAVTQVANEMEGLGLLTRTKAADDRRVTVLTLTRAGWDALAHVRSVHAEIEEEWAERLGRKRVETTRAVLRELVDWRIPE